MRVKKISQCMSLINTLQRFKGVSYILPIFFTVWDPIKKNIFLLVFLPATVSSFSVQLDDAALLLSFDIEIRLPWQPYISLWKLNTQTCFFVFSKQTCKKGSHTVLFLPPWVTAFVVSE